MRHGMGVWLLSACVVLAGCGVNQEGEAPGRSGSVRGNAQAAQDGGCVRYYADGSGVAGRGRLVQLDIRFSYQAARSATAGAGDTTMELDAHSVVEGTASQLACAWDDDGAVQYEVKRAAGGGPPFAATHTGSAQLSGTRVTRADGGSIHEEVEVSGPLETLRVVSMDPWSGPGTQACVRVAYDVPLTGRAFMRITGDGGVREEAIAPTGLVTDGYSALHPHEAGGGVYRFFEPRFAICTGQAEAGKRTDFPMGMSISEDGLSWERSGPWEHHISSPAEERIVNFSLRVVPPTL